MERAIALAPRSPYYEMRAGLRAGLGDLPGAESDYDIAIALGDRPYLRFERANLIGMRGEPARALRGLRSRGRAAARATPSSTAADALALAVGSGGAAEALADAERWSRRLPQQAESWHARGVALLALGRAATRSPTSTTPCAIGTISPTSWARAPRRTSGSAISSTPPPTARRLRGPPRSKRAAGSACVPTTESRDREGAQEGKGSFASDTVWIRDRTHHLPWSARNGAGHLLFPTGTDVRAWCSPPGLPRRVVAAPVRFGRSDPLPERLRLV